MNNAMKGTIKPIPAERDHLTDLGNARRLIKQHGDDLHYCDEWGKWLVWDETRWASDDTHEAVRRAKATVRALYDDALHIEDDEKRRSFFNRVVASEAAPRIRGMMELAKTETGVPVTVGQLDSDQ
jgi:putative DNA primase/helicase